MFEEALKLYLKFPAEMEYWYKKEKEDEEIDEALVSEIAEGEEATFLGALSEVYELALERFQGGIVDPLGKALSQAADKKDLALSRPHKKDAIADQGWEWSVRPKNAENREVRKSIGCYFMIEKSGAASVLNAYPWIWTKGGGAEALRLAKQLGDGWCVTDGWHIGTINRKTGISIGSESEPKMIVESIAGCLVPHMDLLAREVSKR